MKSVKTPLENLIEDRLKFGFESLKSFKKDADIKKRAINLLFKTKHGQLYIAFSKWKALPSLLEANRGAYTSELQNSLTKILRSKLKIGFEALREQLEEKREIQNHAIRKLIISTTHRTKYAFSEWVRAVRIEKDLESCKNLITAFNIIQEQIRNETKTLLEPTYLSKKKNQAIL